MVQGYGLTETCAGLTIQATDDLRGGIAGRPVPSVEMKMVSTPDVCDRNGNPYLSTDRLDTFGHPVFGRGEIVARGPSITCGYYMMPEQTKEEFKVWTDDEQDENIDIQSKRLHTAIISHVCPMFLFC